MSSITAHKTGLNPKTWLRKFHAERPESRVFTSLDRIGMLGVDSRKEIQAAQTRARKEAITRFRQQFGREPAWDRTIVMHETFDHEMVTTLHEKG